MKQTKQMQRELMGLNYTIDCRACGAHTEYRTTICRSSSLAAAHLVDHIDTECAIRCPVCRARLNNSRADFLAQVCIELKA